MLKRLRELVIEIHRRSLWQVLGVYVVSAWIGYEIVLSLTEGLGLPGWVPAFAVAIFVMGLPLVLATACVQEVSAPAPSAPPPAAASGNRPRRPFLTWGRSFSIGIVAFLVLTVSSGAYMGMRVMGIGPVGTLMAKGELEARQPLVVADFQGLTGDTALAMVVTEALRADLAASPSISVADRTQIRDALELMLHPRGAPLDPATAREVALRLGLKGVVEGEIGRAGAGYTLSARLVTADSGRTLASFREAAPDSTAILGAIEGLSRAMRERIGESLRTVRASQPLAEVVTPSLPALRKWAEARVEERRNGNRPRAIVLLNEAVALDPEFAAAWHLLAVLHYNDERRAVTLEAIERALAHQDRLSDEQRYRARAFHASITGDLRTAMEEERNLLLATGDSGAYNSLSDMAWNRGDFADAEAFARVAVSYDQDTWVPYWNLWVAQADQGRMEAARETAERTDAAFPGLFAGRQLLWMQAWLEGDYAAADTLAPGELQAAGQDLLRGRLRDARAHIELADDRPDIRDAWMRLLLLREPAALDRIASFAESDILEDVPERAIVEVGLTLAIHGRPDAARTARAVYEGRVPPPVRWKDAVILHAMDGFVALHEGREEEGLVALRRARESTPWTAPADAFLGMAYDMTERPDSAIAAYTRYLETPWSYRAGFTTDFADPVLLVPIHERLAVLLEDRGDLAGAARHAARVVELWGDADSELQPRVREARRILERASVSSP